MINKKIFSRLGVIAAFLLGICVITTNTGNDNSSSKKTVTASSNTITETKIDNNYEITAGVTSEVLNQTNIKAVDSAIVAKAQEEVGGVEDAAVALKGQDAVLVVHLGRVVEEDQVELAVL